MAAELNPGQLAAATHGDGPLLIIAGAGTGKTRTLVYRVAHLVRRGVRAERILLLTFTRRAAQEMLSRAERLVGRASCRVAGGTFHATGHRLLRSFGDAAGLPSGFSIMDQGDAVDMMGLSRVRLGFAGKSRRFPKKESLQHVYSRHVNTERPLIDIVRDDYPLFEEHVPDITRVFAHYTECKQARNLVDYDDLLLYWALMLEASPELGDRIAALYDHILVDEYQDTNLLQARILRGMCRTHSNITVVGDDAQSIYSFRGASFRNILDFPQQFEGAHIVALEQNYRSTQPILDTTNTLISRAPERYTKELWTGKKTGDRPWLVNTRDEREQTHFVADRIMELHEDGTPLREIAVLFRAGYMSADLEIELANRRIPFEKWGGLRFLEAAHVKDVLAFLRVADNPRDDVSWFRILRLLPGVGEATAHAVIRSLQEHAWDPAAFALFQPPARARDAHAALIALLATLRASGEKGDQDVGAEIQLIRGLYDEILRGAYDRPEPRLADLDQLRVIASGYPGRSTFLAALALEPPQATQDLAGASDAEDDRLILSTAHSAKGKEWDAVFLIWAVDGWFPSSRSAGDDDHLEEERRLMYVALTRARNHLAVVFPLNVYGSRAGAEYSIGQVSRFLDPGVRECMQRVVIAGTEFTGARDAVLDGDASGTPGARPDLRALLRGRFGAG